MSACCGGVPRLDDEGCFAATVIRVGSQSPNTQHASPVSVVVYALLL